MNKENAVLTAVNQGSGLPVSNACCCGAGGETRIGVEPNKKSASGSSERVRSVTIVNAPEIVCGGCAASIRKAFSFTEGIFDVSVDVDKKLVTVEHDDRVSRDDIARILSRAGYSVTS